MGLRVGSLGAIVPDRRLGYDRRRLTFGMFIRGGITPRRRGGRREAEGHALVDWHEPHLMFLAITILLLSMADAYLTLTLLARGAEELNPLLAYVLENAPRLFIAIKMALTGTAVLLLVALSRAKVFRVIKVSAIIHWCVLGYAVLIGYECWLLQQNL